MANIKDFAVGTVVTPPSPATSGVTATLQTGEGATMPAVPFYLTGSPPNSMSTIANSEKVLVTNVTGDVITFTRAQSPTTAKSIAAGWIFVNAVYADDLFSSSVSLGAALTGTVDGTNATFTTASPATALNVYKNGIRLRGGSGNDYIFTPPSTVVFQTGAIPATGAVLTSDIIVGSQLMISGSNSWAPKERVATGAIDSSNTSFTTVRPYIGGTLNVIINGLSQGPLVTESNPSTGAFTIDAPATGDDVWVTYQFVASVTGNADTVDGYHANATPTANMIPVLDSNGVLPAAAMGGAWATWVPTVSAISGTFTTTSSSGKYTQIGKTTHFRAIVTITTVGSGVGVVINLPVTSAISTQNVAIGYGREGASTGSSYTAVLTSSTTANLFRYDNSTTVASGHVYYINGSYEAA